ncbi:unnamed protein product [Musa hybrid cultivar]
MVWVPFEKMNLVFIKDNMGKMITTCSLNVDMVNISTYNTATVDEYNLTFLRRSFLTTRIPSMPNPSTSSTSPIASLAPSTSSSVTRPLSSATTSSSSSPTCSTLSMVSPKPSPCTAELTPHSPPTSCFTIAPSTGTTSTSRSTTRSLRSITHTSGGHGRSTQR